MSMGRHWAWLGICLSAVLLVAWPGAARGQGLGSYGFVGATGTPPTMDFGSVVTEETAVKSGQFRLSDYLLFTGPDPLGYMAVKVHDSLLNRLIFNSQINVEYSGDTIFVPLGDPDTSGGLWSYSTQLPFTISFRPNVKGDFVDTLPFEVIYPIVSSLPPDHKVNLRLRGKGIGFLTVENTSVNFDLILNDTLRVGRGYPGNIRIRNNSVSRLGKISDVFTTRPEFFRILNPQLEIQPGRLEIVQVLFTPRALVNHRDTAYILSEDFAVDTPKVALSGTGEFSFNMFTQDEVTPEGQEDPVHKVIDSLIMDTTTLAGTYKDTLIFLENRIDKRVLGDITINSGDAFRLLRLRGADSSEVDTLIAVGGQVTYRDVVYDVGDTIYVGANAIVVEDTTFVPVVRKIDLTLNDSLPLWIRFRPDLRGLYRDSLVLTYRPFLASDTLALRVDTVVHAKYPLLSRGVGGSFVISKTLLDFGPLTPPLKRRDSVLITNPTGRNSVNVKIDTTGIDPTFVLQTDTAFSVAPGGSSYAIFEYSAVDSVLHESTVPVTSSDPNNPSASLLLRGGTQAPLIVPTTKTLAFGDVVVGDSLEKTIQIANNGLAVLNVTGMTVSLPARFSAAPTTFSLNPGESQTVTVKFIPGGPSAYTDTLRVASNDPVTSSLKIALSGGGSNPLFSSAASLTFGATTLGSGFLVDSVSVHNGGTRGFMIVGASLLHGTYFSLARPSDSVVFVGPGKTLYIPIRFDQLDTALVYDSLVLVPNDPAVDTAYVSLSGGGFFKELSWKSGPLSITDNYQFGLVPLSVPDTLTSVMTNLGNDTLKVMSVSLYDGTQGFKRLSASAGNLLQNELFNVAVVFGPTDTGVYYDTMMIVTNDTASGNDTIIVPLEGSGYVLGLHPSSSPFVFDTTQVGGSQTDSVALANTGDSTIYILGAALTSGVQFEILLPDTAGQDYIYAVPGSAQQFVSLRFRPTDTIDYADTLIIASTYTLATEAGAGKAEAAAASYDTLVLPIMGAGAGGLYTDNVDSLKFTSVLPFGSSQRQFVVSNAGNQPLALTSIKVKTAGSAFARQSPASLVLGAGEQTTVTIQFQPLSSNAFADTLIVLTSDPSNDTVKIPMYGETNDADIDFSPGRLTQVSSPSITTDTTVNKSASGTVLIYNVGLQTLVVDSAKLDSVGLGTPWSFVRGQAANKSVAPGGTLKLSYIFAPPEKRTYNNAMTIWSSDPDEPLVRVTITGHGLPGQLKVRVPAPPDTARWNLGAVKVLTSVTSSVVRVQNIYGADVRLSKAEFLSPADSGEFVVEKSINSPSDTTRTYTPLLPTALPTIPSNYFITLRVKYSPSNTGSDNNVFRIIGTNNQAGDTIDIPIIARGAAPTAVLSPTFYDFGEKLVTPTLADSLVVSDTLGDTALSIQNTGSDTLKITALTRTNAGAAAYNDTAYGMVSGGTGFSPLPWVVPAGSTRTFRVQVKPLTRKIYYDTLALTTNDPDRPTVHFYTRLVGIAAGDAGMVDTVRISETENSGSTVIVPVNLLFDEPIKRITIPLKYSSASYECVGIDFRETLLETVDGRLPTIDTANNVVVVKATAIFSPPIVPNQFVGTQIARLLFQPRPGAIVTDSTITIDTLATLDTSSVRYILQDTAQQIILPVFVAGRLDIVTAVNDEGQLPIAYELEQNFPNPFNPTTTIAFSIPKPGQVRLVVFNLLGQRILTLVDDVLPAGRREVEWNGRDQYGRQVSSGIYFYRLSTEDFSETRKMILMK